MANSNLYGYKDRRKRQKTPSINAGDCIEQVYKQYGYIDRMGIDKDETRPVLEMTAQRRALSKLDKKERDVIEKDIEQLKTWCGRGFGDASALQILAHLGIYLVVAEQK